MSRRAAIVEEFDDDTDLPLPSRSLPNTGSHGAILEEIVDSDNDGDGDSDEAPELLGHSAVSRPVPQPGARDGNVTDITPYKKWTCIYPIYIDAKRRYETGARRISRSKSVWWPLSKDIADACSRLGLGTLHEVNKMHPSDWENPGRVRVQWKKDGNPVNSNIRTKKQLLETISFQIQGIKADNIPLEPYTYPPPAPPPTAKSTKSKTGAGKPAAGAQSSKAKSKSTLSQRTGRPLPSPPEPQPALKSRVSTYSPAVPSGVLMDTIRAGMNATEGQGALGGIPSGKGKRKVVRVRG
ncbi:signal recognition particle, SRP19 subunit [Multifurca ochricompacta]|uniref:Signal recognition particle, SRP19 subunit n=1 Tax=Multifurca ochricompacta TaxID=376703 RepID=A0AAD4QMY2_9AGAM|nr:signal recognition particle, SRP19 subunit [Multifurca ochricompacta]